jgi:hypothetical protein
VVDRRGLLGAGLAGALLAGCGGSGPADRDDALRDDRDDRARLNGLLELEHRKVALYAGLPGAPALVGRLLAHERDHVERLRAAVRDLRGRPVKAPGRAQAPDDAAPLELVRRAELTAVAEYLDALAAVKDARTRGLLAAIVAVEAEHLAAADHELGRRYAPEAFVTGARVL